MFVPIGPNGDEQMTTDKFLRPDEVVAITGVSRAYRYELIARGEFPKPIKIGERLNVWSAAEISAWQEQRIAKRDRQLESA
jgi:prophage regulatory protein